MVYGLEQWNNAVGLRRFRLGKQICFQSVYSLYPADRSAVDTHLSVILKSSICS